MWEREKRSNRINVKPLVSLSDKYIFSPVIAYYTLNSWKNGMLDWYLPYEIGLSKLHAVLSSWKKHYEDKMVDDIADFFRKAGYYPVYTEVDLASRFPGEDFPESLGDYDVFAVNESKKEVWIIESKVLQKVGSIYEDQMQQKSFFYQHRDDEKFQRRIDYMTKNIDKVLGAFEIENSGFSVVAYMVTNKLFTSKYKDIAFPIISFHELQVFL